MRLTRYNFLFVVGLMLTIGLSAAIAGDRKDKGAKIPKKMAALRVTTTDISTNPTNATYPVKLDGNYLGQSGAGKYAEFFVTPGFHVLEVVGPDGKTFSREIEFRRGVRECICLNVRKDTVPKECPYRMVIDRSKDLFKGEETITFTARNVGSAMAVKYFWEVTNGVIVGGQGEKSITVRANKGVGEVDVDLDVNDDVYDGRCRQELAITTEVEPDKPPEITKISCDVFDSKSNDDDKARLDNCMIMAQNTPDSQLYIIIYPGTDRTSLTRNTYDKVKNRSLNYLVKRGMDPARIHYARGSSRNRTSYEIWIVPVGAEPPVIQ